MFLGWDAVKYQGLVCSVRRLKLSSRQRATNWDSLRGQKTHRPETTDSATGIAAQVEDQSFDRAEDPTLEEIPFATSIPIIPGYIEIRM